MSQRILILGGGCGGVYAAKRLEALFADSPEIEIILLREENFLRFTPMLPEVISSAIEATHIISPIRTRFRKVKVQNGEVRSIDLEKCTVITSQCDACAPGELTFDHLVLALGSRTHFFGLSGFREHALPMKTLSDAMVLRNHVIDVLKHADMHPAPATREAMLTLSWPLEGLRALKP